MASLLVLPSCNGPLSLLMGGGPKVAANIQAGKTNTQTVGSTTVNENKIIRPQARTIKQDSGPSSVKADEVHTVVVNEVPTWVILLLVLGWLLPSPGEIGRGLLRLLPWFNKDTSSV